MAIGRTAHTATLLPDGRVLAIGCRWTPSGPFAEVYDSSTGVFSPVEGLQADHCEHVAIPLVDGRVLVAEGTVGSEGTLQTTELFDPRNGTSDRTGDPLERRG